jgi:sterol desaturase/sphingolipid hydroxylase (fatty acid hydroxylase superfamily)
MSFAQEDLPDTGTLLATVVLAMMLDDGFFHFAHRLMHTKLLYPLIHKRHHEYQATVSVATEYSHPLDFLAGGLISGSLLTLILGEHLHFATVLAWTMLRTAESIDGHCGYEFPWCPFRLLPLSSSASYHDFHHSHNVGNYSSLFSFWDTIFNTNQHFYEYELSKAAAKGKTGAPLLIEDGEARFNRELGEKLRREQKSAVKVE